MRIKLGVLSELERFRAATYATKEPETLEWITRNLRDDDIVFDIGANIGVYALYAAKLNPKSTVWAFEPESQNFARLCNNIVLNALQNVVPCNIPMADSERFGFFFVRLWQAGASFHSFGEHAFSTPPVLRQGSLSASLDSLILKYGVPQPNLIKLDVDGIEDKILAGGEKVLHSPSLRSVLVEIHESGDAAGGPAVHLARAGFRAVGKSEWIDEHGGLRSQNFIFSR